MKLLRVFLIGVLLVMVGNGAWGMWSVFNETKLTDEQKEGLGETDAIAKQMRELDKSEKIEEFFKTHNPKECRWLSKLYLPRKDDGEDEYVLAELSLAHVAAYAGLEKVVKFCINEKKILINDRCSDLTVLHLVTAPQTFFSSKKAVIDFLLEKRAELQGDSKGWTPLYYAINLGNKKLIDLFLKYEKTDLKVPNDLGETILHRLCIKEVVKELGQNGWEETVGEVLDKVGGDKNFLNKQNNQGDTFLHTLLLKGGGWHEDVAFVLDRVAIDVNLQNSDGKTPLHIACEKNNYSAVDLLLKNESIDVKKRDKQGRFPVHSLLRAFRSGTTVLLYRNYLKGSPFVQFIQEILEKLITKESLNAEDKAGFTLLRWATKNKNTIAIDYLLKQEGISVEKKDFWLAVQHPIKEEEARIKRFFDDCETAFKKYGDDLGKHKKYWYISWLGEKPTFAKEIDSEIVTFKLDKIKGQEVAEQIINRLQQEDKDIKATLRQSDEYERWNKSVQKLKSYFEKGKETFFKTVDKVRNKQDRANVRNLLNSEQNRIEGEIGGFESAIDQLLPEAKPKIIKIEKI